MSNALANVFIVLMLSLFIAFCAYFINLMTRETERVKQTGRAVQSNSTEATLEAVAKLSNPNWKPTQLSKW